MRDRLFYITIVILLVIATAMGFGLVHLQKESNEQKAKTAYEQCLETNQVRTLLNTDKQILRNVLLVTVQSGKQSIEQERANPTGTVTEADFKRAEHQIAVFEESISDIKDVELRDCENLPPIN